MARRPGFVLDHFIRAGGRWPLTKSPNSQADVISTQIRCNWPYPAPKEAVIEALTAVYEKALADVDEWFSDD